MPFQGTCKLQSSGTTPDQIITNVFAWQHLLIWTGLDVGINHRVTTAVEVGLAAVSSVECRVPVSNSCVGCVDRVIIYSPGLQIRRRVRNIFASGYGDRAKPLSVSCVAIVTVSGQRVLSGGCGVARNLL